jgi:hypothetical protein
VPACLSIEWFNHMPKRKSKSSKFRNKPSREVWLTQRKSELEAELASVDAELRRLIALKYARHGPDDTPEKDTYVPIDDLVEGAHITGPAAGRPALTVWWSQDDLTEWIIFANRVSQHFAKEKKSKGRRVLAKEGIPYILQCEPPRGGKMSKELAEKLFMICRKIADGSGGRLPENEIE